MLQVMDDLRAADVDFLTIGQYLQPTRKHAEVKRFVPPDEFEALRAHRRWRRASCWSSASPLTRSSYHAGEDFARLNAPHVPPCRRTTTEATGARIPVPAGGGEHRRHAILSHHPPSAFYSATDVRSRCRS